MLHHIVLLKTKPGLSPVKHDRILTDAREKLTTISGVMNLYAGTPADPDSDWNICLAMDFQDEQALQTYRIHPVHVAYVRDNLEENVIKRQALDFWME